jgi:hypothetical protein
MLYGKAQEQLSLNQRGLNSMPESTGWFETTIDEYCDHVLHLVYDPTESSQWRQTNWTPLNRLQLAVFVLTYGISAKELASGTVMRERSNA